MNQTSQRPKPVVLSRVVWLLLLVCGSLYLLVCVAMAVLQRSLIYLPSVFTREQVDQMAQSARLERWTNSAGEFIGLKRPSPRQPADGTVMIMYGNASTAIGCEPYANDIQGVAALDIFILEYPGYEDRPGSPSQNSLFTAADEAFHTLSTNQPIYLVGGSLGTGVATYLAGLIPTKSRAWFCFRLLIVSPMLPKITISSCPFGYCSWTVFLQKNISMVIQYVDQCKA